MQLETLYQVALHARDLGEAKTFYQDMLGATYIATYDPPGLLFFDFSGVRLLIETSAKPATLYFKVDDIEAAHSELTSKGIAFDSPPHLVFKDTDGTFGKAGTEEWMGFFRDPSDNILAIVERRES